MIENIVIKDRYLDSVMLMSVAAKVKGVEGVEDVSVMMGSDENKEIMRNSGLLVGQGESAGPGDLVCAVKASSKEVIDEAIERIHEGLEGTKDEDEGGGDLEPRSVESAISRHPEANLAFFSIPGPFVRREAEKCLDEGLNLMLFSDNVSIEDELALKTRARDLGLIVMGPDCGTAIINKVALGFANVLNDGPFGIIAASGTGLQEVSVILSNRGYGITQGIGLGGRDLKEEIGGISMLTGIEALEADPKTEVIVLISKPPAAGVAEKILDRAASSGKKFVVSFLKGDPTAAAERNLPFAASLEAAAMTAIAVYEGKEYEEIEFWEDPATVRERARAMRDSLGEGTCLRGLYSGGTLADESLLLLSRTLGDINSNIPLKPELALVDPNRSVGHTIVDLGEDEFTKGRPHPMIDFTLRCERIIEEAKDPATGLILLDVVLGYGSNDDPAGELIPAIEEARRAAGRPIGFVGSICGTDLDPQNASKQRERLKAAGVEVLPTNAQAARFVGLVLGEGRVS